MKEQFAVARPPEAILATNKVIRNTYTLLSITLLFSALTAGLALVFEMPFLGILVTLGGYGPIPADTAEVRRFVRRCVESWFFRSISTSA